MGWLDGGEDLLTAQLGLYELISPNSVIDESSLTNIRTAQFSQSHPFAASPRFRSSDRPNETKMSCRERERTSQQDKDSS